VATNIIVAGVQRLVTNKYGNPELRAHIKSMFAFEKQSKTSFLRFFQKYFFLRFLGFLNHLKTLIIFLSNDYFFFCSNGLFEY
jgi:hypothetical protein